MDIKVIPPIRWNALHDIRTLGPKLVQETEDNVRLIRDHLREVFDRQKSYGDQRRKEIEFEVRDQVFPEGISVEECAEIRTQGRYCSDPGHVIQIEDVDLRPYLSYEEEPVQILDGDERIIRNRRIQWLKFRPTKF
ncbi:uncharacterized protein LOC120143948 [Hibiscus syriacus]|uniref:uncharacterized protein LOC120143948 n=1 Tax=Hibiscus syriacus TaxID=106335 RepID=UPI001923159E|nr:uncharacterized protein LOC120143948 [Hibiscus syriacus]